MPASPQPAPSSRTDAPAGIGTDPAAMQSARIRAAPHIPVPCAPAAPGREHKQRVRANYRRVQCSVENAGAEANSSTVCHHHTSHYTRAHGRKNKYTFYCDQWQQSNHVRRRRNFEIPWDVILVFVPLQLAHRARLPPILPAYPK